MNISFMGAVSLGLWIAIDQSINLDPGAAVYIMGLFIISYLAEIEKLLKQKRTER